MRKDEEAEAMGFVKPFFFFADLSRKCATPHCDLGAVNGWKGEGEGEGVEKQRRMRGTGARGKGHRG